jgi:alkylation response protein AidB-like acyl-CoA dehydrogenase
VRFAPTPEQAAMADAVRDLLARACAPEVVRAAWDDDGAAAREVLGQLGATGLLALLVDEAHGGLGLDTTTMVPALEQVGYAGAPGPVVDTVTIAAPLLAAAGHPAAEEVLAGGFVVATGLGRLDAPLPHALIADLFLLEHDDGPRVFTRDEVEVEPVAAVDGARRLGRVRPIGTGHQVDGDEGRTATSGAARLETARLGTAAELIGLGQRMLDLTVSYVQQREQFGTPVGVFQAVKHQLADAKKALAFARPAIRRAGYTLAEGWASGPRDVAVAKAVASDAADLTSRVAIQCHGAIGYTVEYDLHLYAKRTWALLADRGDASSHRLLVADQLGLPAGATR